MKQNVQQIRLELDDVNNDDLIFLFGNKNPNFGFKKKLSENVEIENRTAAVFGIEPVSTLTIFISISSSIVSSVAASFIYDWLKGRFSKCHLNNITIQVNRKAIKDIIEQSHINEKSKSKKNAKSRK